MENSIKGEQPGWSFSEPGAAEQAAERIPVVKRRFFKYIFFMKYFFIIYFYFNHFTKYFDII
jgi:hypothetical protein